MNLCSYRDSARKKRDILVNTEGMRTKQIAKE